jgi:hypothetical protein
MISRRHPLTAWKRCGTLTSSLILAITLVAGCTQPLAPPIRSGEPIGVQLMRTEPMFVGQPFRVLVDFESPSDLVFIGESAGAHVDTAVAHTGTASLRVPGSAFTVKLPALLPSTVAGGGGTANFPGSWTLVGAYFIAQQSTAVRISYEVNGKSLLDRSVTLAPRRWMPVFLDVSSLADPNGPGASEVGVLKFTPQRSSGEIWCDDIVALDNTRSLITPGPESAADCWSLRQRGFVTIIDKPGSFSLDVPTSDGEAVDGSGWRIDEVGELRICLSSASGKHARVIYCDGREYDDGAVKSLLADTALGRQEAALFAEQQKSPATLSVPEELGRLERNAPGDRDNDGYAELRGAYQLKATGPRFEVKITPQTLRLLRPVLEISGLPAGRVLAHVEGQQVERVSRLRDGHVLIMLPHTLDRAVTVNVRVQ